MSHEFVEIHREVYTRSSIIICTFSSNLVSSFETGSKDDERREALSRRVSGMGLFITRGQRLYCIGSCIEQAL